MWKVISKYPTYSISEDGKVRNNKTGRTLKINISSGYKKVALNGVNCHIHRLLAEAFIPNPDNKKVVVHVDGNKLNNDLRNLRWQDDKYNETKSDLISRNKIKRKLKKEWYYGISEESLLKIIDEI